MVDFLIVGQGIAGSVLALHLLNKGKRILVINNRQQNCASSIAPGVYNPITGRGMVKTWLAEALFPYLISFYRQAEQTLGAQFLHLIPIFRPFLTEQERAIRLQREPDAFVEAIVDATYHQENMVYHHGGIVLRQSGYLDVPTFLKATRIYLESQGAYIEADFVYADMCLGNDVGYHDLTARQVIFCEGPQAKQNPFFSTLPFRLVKGEVLSVVLQQPLEVMYNRRIFVVPQASKRAVVGATYDWHDLTLRPTKKARQFLEERLCRTFKLAYTVQDQRVGIRPATFDRRPFIGLHPQYPQIGIFNGLGTKGVSLAPYLAKAFVDHLLAQAALPQEVQLNRIYRDH